MTVTLDWLGCATYRLAVDGLVVYLDSYLDRPDGAPDVGLTSADVTEADYALIGHAHWDHIAGADVIAKHTGARIIGSFESMRVLAGAGVPQEQLLGSQGGETHRLNEDVTVQVFPSIHSCIWARTAPAGTPVSGDLGLTNEERRARLRERRERRERREPRSRTRNVGAELLGSREDGGALIYRIETPEGVILFQDSLGYWSGVLGGIDADVAILSASGRGNVDGEPVQGAIEDFIAQEVELIGPSTVIPGHHDNFAGEADRPDVADL